MWTEKNDAFCLTLKFRDFSTAWAFMTEVALISEKMNHHPSWDNVYNQVDIRLNTHDQGNKITEKDHLLAAAIDKILKKYQYEIINN